MDADYKQMYAIMVKAADDAITMLQEAPLKTNESIRAGVLLQDALLKCEELYVEG